MNPFEFLCKCGRRWSVLGWIETGRVFLRNEDDALGGHNGGRRHGSVA